MLHGCRDVHLVADCAPPGDVAPATTDFAEKLDALRIAVGEAALVAGRVESFAITNWRGTDAVQVERMTCLLKASSKAATAAVAVAERFHAFVATQSQAENR
jgi:hypothetical protein